MKIAHPIITCYEGHKKSLRLTQLEDNFDALPENQKADNLKYQQSIAPVQLAKAVTAVATDLILPVYGGIEIVYTAGHHPGHISMSLPKRHWSLVIL